MTFFGHLYQQNKCATIRPLCVTTGNKPFWREIQTQSHCENAHLECRGHEGVVYSGLGEEGEVDVEAAEVQRHWDGQHERGCGHKLLDQLQSHGYFFQNPLLKC